MTEKHQILLLADASGVTKAFDSVSKGATKVSADLTKVGTTGAASLGKVSSAATALNNAAKGVVISSLIGFLGDSARAAADAEAQIARMAQAFENSNDSIDNHTAALEAAGKAALAMAFDDEDAADAIVAITNATGDAAGAIDLVGVAMDLARAKGMSLADAATIIGKVAAGNTAILTRYGIVIDKNATSTEALAALQQRFAGQAQAFAGTQRGAIDKLAVSWGNLQEQIGGMAGPLQAVLGVMPGVSAGFQAVAGSVAVLTESERAGAAAAKAYAVANTGLASGLGIVALAAGVAVAAYKQQEDSLRALTDAYNSANAAILANTAITDKNLGAVKLVGQGFFDSLGGTIAQSVATRDLTLTMGEYALAADDAATIGKEQAASLASATVGANDLAAATDKLNTLTNAHTISAKDAIAANADLAAIYAETGPRGEIAQQAALNLNAAWLAGTITEGEYRAGLHEVNTDLAANATAAATAAGATTNLTQAQKDAAASDVAAGIDGQTARYEAQAAAIDKVNQATLAAGAASGAGFGAGGFDTGEIRAAATAVADAHKATADAAIAATQAIDAASQAQISDAHAVESALRDTINAYTDEALAAADRAGAQATRGAEATGRASAQAVQAAGRESVRAAELAQRDQVMAANAARDGQIAAAQDAEKQQVAAAESAADGQIAAAKQAEEAQVHAAEQAGRAQVSAATKAAHDTVRASSLATNKTIADADRMEASVADAAKAKQDATVKAATAAHDATVSAAEDAADAEITAAKHSADQQLIQLDRLSAAKQVAISADAGRSLQNINDAAAKAIQGGASVGKISNQMAKDTSAVYAKQIRDQQAAVAHEEQAKLAIADQEAAKEKAAQDAKDAASEAAATTEAASKRADAIRKQAAKEQAQVETDTAREVSTITKQAAQDAAKIAVHAANETKRITESAHAGVDAVKAGASANTAAVTAAANAEAAKVARVAQRETDNARKQAEQDTRVDARTTADTLQRIARETAAVKRNLENSRTTQLAAAHATELAQETEIKTKAEEANTTILTGVANADAATAAILVEKGVIEAGATGSWQLVESPENAAVREAMKALGFGPDAVALTSTGSIVIKADWTNYDKEAADRGLATTGGGGLKTSAPLARPTPSLARRHGGVVSPIPARHGRVVTVGEHGREDVLLPAGSYVRPNSATEASHAGGGGITLQINGDVYGMDDFEGKVGLAAAAVLSRSLPQALASRRQSLGG